MQLYKYINTVAESRLVYADKKGSTSESNSSKELDETSKKQIDEISSSALTPHAKAIAALYSTGKLEGHTLQEIRDLVNDPNKMEKKQNQEFVKALSLGRFPKRGANARHFLKAIAGEGKAAAKAREIVKDLSEDTSGPLTARREKALLKEITDLQEEEMLEETTATTSSAASLTVQTANTSERVKATAKTSKENWALEKAPQELIDKLDRIEYAQYQITKKANSLWEQLKQENAKPDKNPEKIKSLQEQIEKLDKEFDALAQELAEPKKEWIEYLTKSVARYRALESFFRESGIDSKSTAKIRMWMMGLMSKGKSTTSLKMTGVKVNPKTGETSREEETIEIVGISFDTEKDDLEITSPGELVIHYKDKTGETQEAGFKIFLNMINAYEAYPEIDSLAELNRLVAEETNYKNLSEGDSFEAEITKGLDENGNALTEHITFKIETLDEDKQQISLDQSIKTMPRELLSNSLHPSLYFDRHKKDFNFGQFARFIQQHNFRRKTGTGEIEDVLSGLQTHQQQEKDELSIGNDEESSERIHNFIAPTASNLSIPPQGNNQKVVFLDEHNHQRVGILTQDPETNTFTIEQGDLIEDPEVEDQRVEMANSDVPLSIANARKSKSYYTDKELDRYRNISPNQLIDMVRDGKIANLPDGKTSKGKPKWTVNPRAQDAVAAMERSDKGLSVGEDATMPESDLMDTGEEEAMPTGKQQGPAKPQQAVMKKPKSNGYEEALPFDDVRKVGGMTYKEANFAKKIWAETRLLSVSDFWEMGKAMWEYYDRRWQRRQKERYSSIGQELPFFAPEMRRVNQSAENEEVDQFKSTFDQKGIYEIQARLNKTRNKDEMKAAFTVLSEKGQVRWDDLDMWRNINRFVDASVAVPIPSNGDPNTMVDAISQRTGFDYLQGAVDSLWGEGTYNDWFQRNKGSYASNLKNFYEEGKQLEGVQGGHGRRLSELLRQHKRGEYVDPHEYEGLIMHAIDFGKSSMQNKIYFLVEGVAAVNSDGRTIMSFDRMAHVNSEMLAKFPILEYLCAQVPRPGGGVHRFTIEDYKRWAGWFDEGNPMNCTAGPAVDRFMWKYVIPSEPTKNRINKAFRNGEQIDHDDMFAYLPPASEQVITDATRATTGSKKFFTVEGYANAFPGFSEYFRSLGNSGNSTKILQGIKSYFRYEAIMTGRFEKERWNDYQRLDQDTMRRQTIVSSTPPIAFTKELNLMMDQIVAAYDDPELNETYALATTVTGDIQVDQNEMQKQKKVNAALQKIGDVFDRVLRSDSGAKMTSIVASSKLEGMPYGMSDAEKEARKAAFSDDYNSM